MISATLDVPANRACPIAARIAFQTGDALVDADFDFLQTGEQTWDIEVDTDAGTLRLRQGGSRLELPNAAPMTGSNMEYPRLYARFAALVQSGASDVDVQPLQLVIDALAIGERRTVAPFAF